MPILPKPPPRASGRQKLLDLLSDAARARFLGDGSAPPEPSSAPAAASHKSSSRRRARAAPAPKQTAARKPLSSKEAREARRTKKREAAAAKRSRQGIADAVRLEKLSQAIEAAGGRSTPPRLLPGPVFRMCWQVCGDATGAAARIHLRSMKNRVAAAMIIEASIGSGDARDGRTWANMRTRRLAALGIGLVMLAEPTKRRGRWNGVVKGIPRGALAALLADPFDDRATITYDRGRRTRRPAVPHTNTLFGTHRQDSDAPSDHGYFAILRRVGLVYSQQLPAGAEGVEPREKNGPSGHVINRYWIVAAGPDGTVNDETRAELLKCILDAATVATQWENERRRRSKQLSQAGPPI